MKQKLKTYLKISIFLLIIPLLTEGCQEDETKFFEEQSQKIEEQEDIKQARFTTRITNLEHLRLDYPKVSEQIKELTQSDILSRTESEEYGFYIDEDKVQIIEVDSSYTLFTFIAERNYYVDELENYVLKSYPDGSYEQYLLGYTFTINDEGQRVYNTDQLSIMAIDDDGLLLGRTNCVPELVVADYYWMCEYREQCTGNFTHNVGESCPCEFSDNCDPPGWSCGQEPIYGWSTCPSGAGHSEEEGPNHPNGEEPDGTTTTGTNTGNEEEPTPSSPVSNVYAELIEDCINTNSPNDGILLSAEQIDFLFNRTDEDNAGLYGLLRDGRCDEASQQRVLEEVEKLITDQKNCESLNKLSQTDEYSANINPMVTALKNLTGEDKEYSISYRKNINGGEEYSFADSDGILEGDSKTGSNIYTGTVWFGGIHTHPEGTTQMFSWIDVSRLRDVYDALGDAFTKEDVFVMVVNRDGTVYALKINNITTLIDKLEEDLQNTDALTLEEKELELRDKLNNEYNANNNLELTFLKKFKDYGVSLFKADDDDLSSWSELNLDDPNSNNQEVTPRPCN